MSGPERERGAALLVVLSLLVIATVMVLSGLESSLIDERLAGNLRAQAQAQMAAEWGGAERLGEAFATDVERDCGAIEAAALDGAYDSAWSPSVDVSPDAGVGYRYIDCRYQDDPAQLIQGFVGDGERVIARHFVLVASLEEPGGEDIGLPELPEGCDTLTAGVSVNYGPNDIAMCQYSPLATSPSARVDEALLAFSATDFGPGGCHREGSSLYCASKYGFAGIYDLADFPGVALVVVDGNLAVTLPEGRYATSFLVSGQLTLNPTGAAEVDGDLWATGIAINGDLFNDPFVVNGGVVASGVLSLSQNVSINGSTGETSGGASGTLWIDRPA